MAKIIDFNCTFQYSAGINENVTKKLDLKFPDAYMKRETMAEIALAIKEYDEATFCELPFCHTVEAESIGGLVNYGDEKAGPRAKEYICTKPEEILELKEIDFSTGNVEIKWDEKSKVFDLTAHLKNGSTRSEKVYLVVHEKKVKEKTQ